MDKKTITIEVCQSYYQTWEIEAETIEEAEVMIRTEEILTEGSEIGKFAKEIGKMTIGVEVREIKDTPTQFKEVFRKP